MKKLLTFLTLLTLSIGVGWAAELTTTIVSTNSNGSSLVWDNDDFSFSFTTTPSSTQYSVETASPARGLGTGAKTGTHVLTSDQSFSNVTKIEVVASTNGTNNTISASVGETTFGAAQTITSGTAAANTTYTFNSASATTGNIVITINDVNKSVWVKTITITYSEGGDTPTPTCQKPTFSPDGETFYEPQTVTISSATDGATIYYTKTANGEDPTTSSPSIASGGTVEISESCVLRAMAVADGYLNSGVKSATYTINLPQTVSTVAEIVALQDETPFTFSGSLVVSGQATYNNHKYLYAQDGTGGMLFFDANQDYTMGDVIPVNFTGTKTTYNGAPEVKNINMEAATTHDQQLTVEEVAPDGITVDPHNVFEYSVIKNATITYENSKYYIKVGDKSVQIYDRFGHAVPSDYADKEFDVYGVSGWYNGAQFMPLEFVEHVTPTHNITYGTLTNGAFNTDENPEEAAEGSTVTIKTIPTAGYKLDQLTVTPSDNNVSAPTVTIDGNNATFTMPESDVTVSASFKLADNPIIVNIVPSNSGGNIWVYSGTEIEGVKYAKMGDDIYFRVVTDQYNSIIFQSLTIKDADGTPIDYEDDGNDGWAWEEGYYGRKFKFVMPATAVTLTAQYDMNRGTLCLAGHFDGNSSWRTSGPEFTYDSNSDTYTIDAYFTGIDDNGGNDYFFLTLDGVEKHPKVTNGSNYYISDLNGGSMPFELSGGSGNNFGCAPGVYHIEINGTLTSMKFTKQKGFIFDPPTGSTVSPGQTVTATSNAATKIAEIKTKDTGAQGDVTTQLSLNNSDWYENVTLENVGNNIPVYAKMYLSNIYDDAQATYNVAEASNSNQYELVTDINDMESDKKYLIVSAGSYKYSGTTYNFEVAATTVGDNDLLGAIDVIIENNIITLQEGTTVVPYYMTLSDGKWTFKNSITNEYLTFSNPNTGGADVGLSETSGTGFVLTSLDTETGVVVLTQENNESRTLKFNPNNAAGTPSKYRFTTYLPTATTVKPIMLFKQKENTVILPVATPVITPGTGTYNSAQDVEITCSTPDATIYYKTTEMDDYATGPSPVSLTISANTTLTAYATKTGYNDSETATAIYTFEEPGVEEFTLVTEESQLIAGNEYVIVICNEFNKAFGTIDNANAEAGSETGFTISGDHATVKLTENSNVNVLTLGTVEKNGNTYYTLKQKNGKFIYVNPTGSQIKDDDVNSSYTNEFTISINGGSNNDTHYARIQGGGGQQILYRTYGVFRHYSSSNETGNSEYRAVLLYTKATTPVEEPTEATLAQIITLGENADGKLYKINNDEGLLGVYKNGTSIWFKDKNGEAVDIQVPGADDKFYVVDEGNNVTTSEKDFDQSNWIEVVLLEDREEVNYVSAYVKNLTGTYSWQDGNPKLTLTVAVADNDVTELTDPADEYTPNPYMAANFLGSQEYTNSQGVTSTYFFPMPKAQEYAKILWAVWDGEKMNMPTVGNVYGFQGSFTLNNEFCSLDGLTPGHSYDFEGVIRKVAAPEGSKAAGDNYEVSPIRISDTPTAISTVGINGNVKSVKYVNVAGIVSDVPFQGVNIVVTEYTDGSRTTTKMLKK